MTKSNEQLQKTQDPLYLTYDNLAKPHSYRSNKRALHIPTTWPLLMDTYVPIFSPQFGWGKEKKNH